MSQHTATITATGTSAKGTHYVVTLDGEVVGTRTSPRVYRSAVVVVNAKKGPGVYAYAGTEQLAQNRMGEVRKGYPTEPVIIARWAEPSTDAEPSTEAAPAPEPKPTRSSAKPKKPAPAAKAKATPAPADAEVPECPRKHTASAAIERCRAYYLRNGHFKPTHVKAEA